MMKIRKVDFFVSHVVFYLTMKCTPMQNSQLDGTQKWLQVVWNNTYLVINIAPFSAHHHYN